MTSWAPIGIDEASSLNDTEIVEAPKLSNVSVILEVAPLPTARMAMTAAIPIIIPNIVKKERILLTNILSIAILKFSLRFKRPAPFYIISGV